MEGVSKIARVESVTICLNIIKSRFVARAIGHLWGIGDILQGSLLRKDEQSLNGEILRRALKEWRNSIERGGDCPTVNINVRGLKVPGDATVEHGEWEINRTGEGMGMIYSDISKAEGVEGMVGGGGYESEVARGGVASGVKATVWDGEIAGMELALEAVGSNLVLIQSDSRAAIKAVKKAGSLGIGRTRGLKAVVSMIEEYEANHGPGTVSLACVRVRVGNPVNEKADLEANAAVEGWGGLAVTEGCIRAWVKAERKK